MKTRGLALVLVLWLLALMVGVVGAFALTSRIEGLLGRSALSLAQARLAAEAGTELAVMRMREVDPQQRMVPDGRPYHLDFEGIRVTLRVHDETGRLDLNTTDPETLARLFEFHGVEEPQALALADAIADWRDPDDLVMMHGAEDPDYQAAGLPYGAADMPFASVAEVQRVLGMSPDLFARIASSLTVHSGRPVNADFADAAVLHALGMAADDIAGIVDARKPTPGDRSGDRSDARSGDVEEAPSDTSGRQGPPTVQAPPTAADGRDLSASGSGTYSIDALAALADGTRLLLTQTVRVGAGDAAGRPYVVLGTREGEIR